MRTTIANKKLENFLNERGLLHTFIFNAIEQKKEYYLDNPRLTIDGAFTWSETLQDHQFWYDMYHLYESFETPVTKQFRMYKAEDGGFTIGCNRFEKNDLETAIEFVKKDKACVDISDGRSLSRTESDGVYCLTNRRTNTKRYFTKNDINRILARVYHTKVAFK